MSVAVVTGARSGLGLALTRRLLAKGWTVAVVIRTGSPHGIELDSDGERTRLHVYVGDLADRIGRQEVADEIAGREPRIDFLFNVAGVSTGDLMMSPQGLELNYEINTVAPLDLTQRLLPNLEAAGAARVINVSTAGVDYVRNFDPELLAMPIKKFRKLFGAYSDSKLALSLWSKAIAPELSRRNVTILSVDPGANKTSMTRGDGMPAWLLLAARLFFKPPSHGAGLLFDAATGDYRSGDFLSGGKVRELPWMAMAGRTLQVVREDLGREGGSAS